jgi:hypothetical protein
MSDISFEQLVKITEESRLLKNQQLVEKIKKARIEAINHITQNCFEKMNESASKGFDKTFIYSTHWVSDRNSELDSNGNKRIFNDIVLIDILKKGYHDFIKDLNDFFNKDGDNKYSCGIYRKKKKTESDIEIWYIYVSWGKKPEKKKFIPGFKRNTNI